MAFAYKILGQIKPNANTLTNVYVTPAATAAIVNTITVCNQGPANSTIDLVLRPINEALANKHYILRSIAIPQADTLILSPGITMNANMILAANNTLDANVSISAFGVEDI
jgi:hypothetical protein